MMHLKNWTALPFWLSVSISFLMCPTLLSALDDSGVGIDDVVSDGLGSACASISGCHNCSNTYSCHWCSYDEECHAKGSVHGCSWGATCDAPPPPKPKENTTCSSRTTCSKCALSSHLCHWCEHDNACHAIGSPYGCTTGVNCYSNDRCRRKEPEPFHRWIVLDIPRVAIGMILLVGALLVACLSCCHFCFVNVKGAYDDLATISMAASLSLSRPPSVIGGTLMGAPTVEHFYNTLETFSEEVEEEEEVDRENTTVVTPRTHQPASTTTTDEETPVSTSNLGHGDSPGDDPSGLGAPKEDHHRRPLQLESDPMDLYHDNTSATLHTPLLPSSARSFNGIPGMEEPRHMKALYRLWSCLYYLSILLVFSLVSVSLFYFPKPPVYNVCNDAVAWRKIIENILALKLDASFEILVSVSNPNHLAVVLEKASGSFSFEGQAIGTYEIPAETVPGMAITDLMLIAKVMPDKFQIVQLAEAYYKGSLVLNAEFNAKLRAPAFFDVTYNVHLKDIDVDVNKQGPRDLCQCPSWDDPRINTNMIPAFLN